MGKAQSKSGILTEKLKVKLKNEHFKDDRQRDGTDVSQEEDGTDDRCNKTEGASLFYGTHEIQELSESGEGDLPICTKKQGHTEFVPVNDFNINHLPEGHQDSDLFEYIKATADLTVKVDVQMVSTERPEFWPNTNHPYPFYDKRGSEVMLQGTGMVMGVSKLTGERIIKYNKGICPCHKCQHSDTPSKVRGRVRMHTARHVVFDGHEAGQTTCRLFFDGQDSPLVTLDGWTVLEANIEEDWCEFECVTCNVGLLDTLIIMTRVWYELWMKVRDKYKSSRDEVKMTRHWYDLWLKVINKYKSSRDNVKLTFIVSHPHGWPKQISVGDWINRCKVSEYMTKYTYTTCTCPGSSGALVHSLGYDGLTYDRHVHSGVNSKGINFSGTGRHWPYYG